ncbi:TPA: HRDC domain-containing protein, partial [Neisseria gonorrhoeae]
AKADEVPAYVICGDKTLRDIVEKQPARLEDLRDVYGLGEAKIEKLGGEILRVVAEHRAD